MFVSVYRPVQFFEQRSITISRTPRKIPSPSRDNFIGLKQQTESFPVARLTGFNDALVNNWLGHYRVLLHPPPPLS